VKDQRHPNLLLSGVVLGLLPNLYDVLCKKHAIRNMPKNYAQGLGQLRCNTQLIVKSSC